MLRLLMVLSSVCLVFVGRLEPGDLSASARSSLLAGALAPASGSTMIYLPLVASSSVVEQDPAIWLDATTPPAPEVVFFRRSIMLDQTLGGAELAIFADTRYEAFLDGTFVGRGPARFSRVTHEYDSYVLGDLAPGPHLLAVLVQWAPNSRRSESTSPSLQAHLQGTTSHGLSIAARTDSNWKAWRSSAWRSDAAPVHTWGLIGPTELVDLRQLPAGWMLASYSDTSWSTTVIKADPEATWQPRSIARLESAPITATVREAGLLSPDRFIGELTPPVSDPYALQFRALAPTTFSVDAVAPPGAMPSGSITLDGDPLVWQSSADRHPDVYRASHAIGAGPHTLTLTGLPQDGIAFAISRQSIEQPALPFSQGTHAGRRVLLGDPVRRSDTLVRSASGELDLTFASTPAYAVLDLGRVTHGRLQAEISGPSGTVLDVGWDERLWQDRRPLPYPGSFHPEWNQTDSWVLDGSTRSIRTIDARAGRYILVAVWGTAPVRLDKVRVFEERYPVVQRGTFRSTNPQLNRIWQVGVDTLYPNMQDGYADPWRERGQWWGDAFVDDHSNRVAFGDASLLKRGLALMAEGFAAGRPVALAPNGAGNSMLDYGMLWVQSLNDYLQETGDTHVPSELYPVLRNFIAYLGTYENRAAGLLDTPVAPWWQTAYIDPLGYNDRYGQSTALNAMYYGTLRDAATIAEEIGNTGDTSAWWAKADLVKQRINASLYLPDQHRFLTSILNGKPINPSPHAQAWALAYGVVPDDEVEGVVSSLKQLISPDPSRPNVEIYGMFWILEALGRTGHIQEALDLTQLYYGRLLNLGATTWWENFTANTRYNNSLSHGWGSAPTWFLTTYVLGARRTGPNSWEVRSNLAGQLPSAGALPLKDGELVATWSSTDCAGARLDLVVPSGSSGEIVLPGTDPSLVLTLNGTIVWHDGSPTVGSVQKQPDGIYLTLESGRYSLDIARRCYHTYLAIMR